VDLIDLWLYIAQANPAAADHLLDTLWGERSAACWEPGAETGRPGLAEGFRCLSVGRATW